MLPTARRWWRNTRPISPTRRLTGHLTGLVDGRVAVEQCKTGNAVAAIPVLEQKLRNAKIALPPRG